MSFAAKLPSAQQLWLQPLLLLVLLFALCYGLELDFVLANFWYQLQHQHWSLQHFWLTEQLLHRAVRLCNQAVILGLLLHFLVRLCWPRRRSAASGDWHGNRQQAHGRLLLTLAFSLAGVALFKQLLPMDCPWDLQAFGGPYSFTGLFSRWPADRASNACFPAGHASIGFAWLGLYFFCLQLYPQLARPALIGSALLGFSLGLVQQLRGAHFISHDIASAAWCWSMACLCAYWPLRRNIWRRAGQSCAMNNNQHSIPRTPQ